MPQTIFLLKVSLIFSDRYQLLNQKMIKRNLKEKLWKIEMIQRFLSLGVLSFQGLSGQADLIHQWVSNSFHLPRTIRFETTLGENPVVAVEAEYEHVKVINNLILIPLPNYKRSGFLDRRVLGLVSLSLGQLWFGKDLE